MGLLGRAPARLASAFPAAAEPGGKSPNPGPQFPLESNKGSVRTHPPRIAGDPGGGHKCTNVMLLIATKLPFPLFLAKKKKKK